VAGFGNRQLESLLGYRYVYRGDELGGRPPGVSERGLLWLAYLVRLHESTSHGATHQNVAIMCMEEAPGDCHRHHAIALPLARRTSVECLHIYRNELIEPTELQRSIDTDTDYDCELFDV
jgi:hypothetical protein